MGTAKLFWERKSFTCPPFTYTTEHRPHAAPKGQEETLIRGGRIHQNKKRYSERGSRKGGPLPREFWRTHFSASNRHCADKAQQRPFSVGRAQGSPVARRCLAFRTRLLGMVGGHLQAELRKLAEGLTASTGPRKLARKRARERNRSLKPPSHPAGVARGRNSSRLLAPGLPRPTATNKIQSLGPVTANKRWRLFKKKKKKEKRKNRLQSPTSIGFKFQGIKKMSQPRGLNIRSQPDQAHVALGQVHCTTAQVASTRPLSLV